MLYDIQSIHIGNRKRKADPVKVAALVDSIDQIGLLNPVCISTDGKLHAGLHRLEAVRYLGWKQIPVNIIDLDELRAELAEIDENLIRNNLNELQGDIQLARRKEIYEQLYPETKHGGDRKSDNIKSNGNNCHLNSFAADAAEKTGKHERTIRNKTRIGEQLKDIADDLEDTPIVNSQKDLLALAGMEPKQRDQVVALIKDGTVESVSKAQTLLRNKGKESRSLSLPEGTYNVIYADPPWRYDNTGVDGAANHHYRTMATEDICSLLETIQLQIDTNAVLFMWVTNPILQDAFFVVNSWGFEYKTNIVWVKTNLKKPGGGFYVRGRHELLFICTKGSFTPINPNVAPPIGSVIEAPVQDHSKKPDEVYGIIEALYPNCRYIELFARQKREKWDSWGDESDS